MESLPSESPDLSLIDTGYQEYIASVKISQKEDLDEHIKTFLKWFYVDEFNYCKLLSDKIEKAIIDLQDKELAKVCKEIVKKTLEIKAIKDDFAIIEKVLTLRAKMQQGNHKKLGTGWCEFHNKENTKVMYKKEPNNNMLTYYCEQTIFAPLKNVIAVIAEAQTIKEWVPMMYRSEITQILSYFRKMAILAIKIPWPWKNKSIYCTVCALPVQNDASSIILALKSLTTEYYLKNKKFIKDPDTTECKLHYCGIHVQTLAPNKQKLTLIVNVDPNLDYVPDWLVNQSSKLVYLTFMQQIAKRAEKQNDEYKKLIIQKKLFYDRVEERLARIAIQNKKLAELKKQQLEESKLEDQKQQEEMKKQEEEKKQSS